MKINQSQRINAVNPYQKQNDQQAGSLSGKRKKDEVRISAEAQEMLTYSRVQNPERTQLINELKDSVSSGTYHVESGKIAEKLLPYLKNYKQE